MQFSLTQKETQMICSHLSHRLKNRSIDKQWINILVNFGTVRYDKQGSMSYHFDRKAIGRMISAYGQAFVNKNLSTLRKLYLVERIDSDKIITVAYKTKRVKRN
jgi:hypothetical protein